MFARKYICKPEQNKSFHDSLSQVGKLGSILWRIKFVYTFRLGFHFDGRNSLRADQNAVAGGIRTAVRMLPVPALDAARDVFIKYVFLHFGAINVAITPKVSSEALCVNIALASIYLCGNGFRHSSFISKRRRGFSRHDHVLQEIQQQN